MLGCGVHPPQEIRARAAKQATAPLRGGGKDPKLTKKRGKHEKKMIKYKKYW